MKNRILTPFAYPKLPVPRRLLAVCLVSFWGMFYSFDLVQSREISESLLATSALPLGLLIISLYLIHRDLRYALPYLIAIGVCFWTVVIRPFIWEDHLIYHIATYLPTVQPNEILSAQWLGVISVMGLFCTLLFMKVARLALNQKYKSYVRLFPVSDFNYKKISRYILLFVFFFLPTVHFLLYHFHIGFHGGGAPPVALPFRLAGILTYFRSFILPLCLIALYASILSGNRRRVFIAVLFLVTDLVVTIVLTSSRGVILGNSLVILFNFLFMGIRFNVRRIALIGCGIILMTGFLFPYLTAYRSIGGKLDFPAMQRYLNQHPEASSFTGSLLRIVARISGTEKIVPILRLDDPVIGLSKAAGFTIYGDAYNDSINGWYSKEVLRIPPDVQHGDATSFVGELFVIGGTPGVFFGTVAFLCVVGWFWNRLLFSSLIVLPLICGTLLNGIINWFSEGGVLYFLLSEKGLIVPLTFYFTLEWGLRWISRPKGALLRQNKVA